MLQILMLVVGIYYLYRLYKMGSAAAKLDLEPDQRDRWRSKRRRQYVWGIVAGWGALVLYILFVGYVSSCATSHCTAEQAVRSTFPGVVLSLVTFIGGLILSERGRWAAIRVQRRSSATAGQAPDDVAAGSDVSPQDSPLDPDAAADDPATTPPADSSANQA